MKKQIFIDTDMGSDCDDVAAVAILSHFNHLNRVEILGITHTCANLRAAEYLNMVCRFYHFDTEFLASAETGKGVGILHEDFLNKVLDGFHCQKTLLGLHAVQLMRKQLAKAKNATVLCIGPLNNMSNFLNSPPDEFSTLTGREMLEQNVSEVVVMGGIFNNKRYDFYGEEFEKEYNICLDVQAAQNFISNCPCPITFVEFELGYQVKTFSKTVASEKETPIKRAYTLFGVKDRESWDVVAAIYSIFGENGYYRMSNSGECTVADDGKTVFTEKIDGKHRYLIENKNKTDIIKYIDEIEEQLHKGL